VAKTATFEESPATHFDRGRKKYTDDHDRGETALKPDGWLTTVLRPAGMLNQPALNRLGEALAHLATTSDMVIVDLTAVKAAPQALAKTLQAPAIELQQPGKCLLLIGAPADLMAELDRAAVSVAVLDE
jgi:hypothetical protein